MNDKTLNVPSWWPDEPIPVYHSKETLEPRHIWISTAGIHNDTLSLLMKEYAQYLDKINQDVSRDLCERAPKYYFTIDEDGLTPMTNEWPDEVVDKFNSIGCTSFVLTLEELEQLLEQTAEENE